MALGPKIGGKVAWDELLAAVKKAGKPLVLLAGFWLCKL